MYAYQSSWEQKKDLWSQETHPEVSVWMSKHANMLSRELKHMLKCLGSQNTC